MSKYEPLWRYFGNKKEPLIALSFEEIQDILGFPIDHSFLNYKKELEEYGYAVKKISLKDKHILFERLASR
jgi:hypothetical protein